MKCTIVNETELKNMYVYVGERAKGIGSLVKVG